LIVRRHHGHLLLITQPDHAVLSAQVMAAWTADAFATHPRRDVILLATREHDAGWADLDVAPLVDERTQKILDFVQAPDRVRQSVWPRSIARLIDQPYAAALVAQHALHVYRDNRPDPGWADFFARIEQLRDEHLARTSLSEDDLVRDYFFVRMGDLVSLFFANHWPGPRTEENYTVRVAPDRVTVSPDPFDGAVVPFTLRGRQMPQRPYVDTADAAAAFAGAPAITLTGAVCGA